MVLSGFQCFSGILSGFLLSVFLSCFPKFSVVLISSQLFSRVLRGSPKVVSTSPWFSGVISGYQGFLVVLSGSL